MKTVLVTGGAGYIGSAVVELLLRSGHRPVVFDSFLWGRSSLAHLGDEVTLIEGDVRNSADVIYALQDVDTVVHLAGIVGQAACAKNHLAHFTTNIEATRTLLSCMTDPEVRLVRNFIYLSSCSVYGNVAGIHEKVYEGTPESPLSEYAEGKLRSERIVAEFARRIPHLSTTILRLTTIFGWSRRLRLDLVANMFVQKAIDNGRITIYGDGQQYRSLIHVNDVAQAVLTTVDAPRYVRHNQIFHVGEETNNITIKDLAELVAAKVPGATVEFKKEAATDRRDYWIDCQKIKNALNWSAMVSVDAGISELAGKLQQANEPLDSPNFRNDVYEYV